MSANDRPALEGTPAPLIVNCGSGTIFTINVVTNQDSGSWYNMITGDGSTIYKTLRFRLYTEIGGGGRRITGGSAILTATGTGSTVTAGYLYGQILEEQAGRDSGSYTKSISISVVFGS